MGRPKGSKNKPKVDAPKRELLGTVGTVPVYLDESLPNNKAELVVKRARKAKPSEPTPLDKLKAAGLTIEDLRALLGEASKDADKPNDKAELRKQMLTAPISPAELAKLRKEAKANTPREGHAEEVVSRAVLEVIKPAWDTAPIQPDGCKHFHVKTFRHGESVSMDKEKWDAALKAHGIRGVVQSSKSMDGLDEGANKVSVWRVMIG